MDKSQIEILKKAIDKYGVSNQIDMLHEEIGELLQAINISVERKITRLFIRLNK